MSGSLAHPAAGFSLAGAAIDAANARRLAAAALAVVALHVGLLAFRPGAASGTYVAASAPPVMAVRMVPARPAPAQPPIVAQPASPAQAPPTALHPDAPPEPLRQRAGVAPTVPTAPAGPGRLGSIDDAVRPAPAAPSNDTHDAAAPLAAAPDYAFGIRLDPGPRPLEEIEPDYPDTIRLREGVVVLRLLIGDTGHVDSVDVVRAEPRGVFEQAAIDAFSKARFSPGLAAGTPVKSQIMVEVQFMPINRGARVSGRTY